MIKHLALVCAATLVALSSSANGRLIDSANPFVGTDGFGNCYLGAQIPYGAIQISPDTDDRDYDCAAGYKYTNPTIQGFSLIHLSGPGVKVRLSDGGILEVTTGKWSEENVYVKAVYLNGKKVEGNRINYDDIKDGAHLHFVMSGRSR